MFKLKKENIFMNFGLTIDGRGFSSKAICRSGSFDIETSSSNNIVDNLRNFFRNQTQVPKHYPGNSLSFKTN